MGKTNLSLVVLFVSLIASSCGTSENALQKKDSYLNLFNTQIDGIQTDQLKQANESFYQGNYLRSLDIYNNILNDFLVADNQEAVINTLFQISACLIKQEKYKESLNVLKLVEKRLELMFDESKEKKYYQIFRQIELGNLYIESGLSPSLEETEKLLKEGFEKAYGLGNKYLIAKSCRNLGYFYYLEKKYELSESFLDKAYSIANKSRNVNFSAQAAHYLGKLYLAQKKYALALENLVIAYKMYQANNYFFQQALLLITVGDVYDGLKENLTAFRFYKRASEMISKSSAIEERIKGIYLELLNKKMAPLVKENPDFKEYDFFTKQSNEALRF